MHAPPPSLLGTKKAKFCFVFASCQAVYFKFIRTVCSVGLYVVLNTPSKKGQVLFSSASYQTAHFHYKLLTFCSVNGIQYFANLHSSIIISEFTSIYLLPKGF